MNGPEFEAAADAVIAGDLPVLKALLRDHPDLIHARSEREHHSTLLHYVSANGVEDVRQKTPPNILEAAKLLLSAGADIQAESDAYGGHSSVLGLTATSCHPENAGVQLDLLTLLLEHGAALDPPSGGSTVNMCLSNGRGAAAKFLAARGAHLDFEGAAGVGRMDLVRELFRDASPQQVLNGFAWACEFGRTEVVRFLLEQGVPVDAKLRSHGNTALHWAAYGGHAEIVRLLLQHGAPVEAKDESYDGTPLDWALHSWVQTPPDKPESTRLCDAVALLVGAGAQLSPDSRQWEKIRLSPEMQAALVAPNRPDV